MATIGTTSRPAYVYDQETDTWVPVGVGPHTHENFVTATTIDAKGDLLAGLSPDTVGRLPIGANGTMLVADSTETLGLAWSNTITIASGSTVPLTIQNNGTGNSFVVNDEVSDTTPFIITAGGSVGIGTTTPDTIFNISSAATQVFIDRYSTDNGAPEIVTRKARGTESSPSAVQSGDVLLWLGARGFGTTAFPSISNSTILMIAGENFTDSARGSFTTFNNTAIGTNTRTEHMRITSAGNVGIGTTTPAAKLDVNGSIKSDNLLGQNCLINGGFDFSQRGAGALSGGNYTLDRWYFANFGTSGNGSTVQLKTDAAQTGFTNYARVSAGSTTTTNFVFSQSLETSEVRKLQGKVVTVSFKYKVPVGWSSLWDVGVYYSTNIDQNIFAFAASGATLAGGKQLSNPTSWTSDSVTFTLPSNATSLGVTFNNFNNSLATSQFDLAQVQLELGSVATPFNRAGQTIQGELAACQRYYQIFGGDQLFHIFTVGQSVGTSVFGTIPFLVTMRRNPDGAYTAGNTFAAVTANFGARVAFSSVATEMTTKSNATVQFIGASGLVAGNAAMVVANNTLSALIAFSAELT